MKHVMYWYQFFTRCEELVPIFHGVNIASVKFEVRHSRNIWVLLGKNSERQAFYDCTSCNAVKQNIRK